MLRAVKKKQREISTTRLARRNDETKFVGKFLKQLKGIPKSVFFKISDRVTAGIPDIIGIVDGHFVAIECKRSEAEKLTKLQEITLDRIMFCGGIVFRAHPDNTKSILTFLQELSK